MRLCDLGNQLPPRPMGRTAVLVRGLGLGLAGLVFDPEDAGVGWRAAGGCGPDGVGHTQTDHAAGWGVAGGVEQ